MSQTRFELTDLHREFEDRAILVGVDYGRREWGLEESLDELARLVDTAGARIVGRVSQRLEKPNPKTFIGAGKAGEIERLAESERATLVVFDDDLTPSQQSNLEDVITGAKVIDRTALILDIFALHAVSNEGKLQVELAQMEYMLPRLRGLWRHLEKTGGGGMGTVGTGGVGTRGPGETQLETDRRLVRKRIQALRRELAHVSANRETQRHARERSGVYRVALVGYTNAGKSTLLNKLTGAGVLAYDRLFATLDSTTRRLELEDGRAVTLTDTVGFINKLPHGLVEAFKSTLDEVREADLLLHVIDAGHPQMREQMRAVNEVLGEIGAADEPQLLVFNKTDAVPADGLERVRGRFPRAAYASGLTGEGLDALRERIGEEAARGARLLELLVPYTRGDLVQLAHESGQIVREEHTGDGTRLAVRVPISIADRFEPFELDRRST
ncbi:MAG TPA: GTPase HflX [Coriobacteriia bacterium]|jgi:GTP-binding protein HflX